MSRTDEHTQAVLAIFSDEMTLAHTLARGWLTGGGVENERDAAKCLEGAAQELLQDGGRSAATLRDAVGCPSGADDFEVLSRVEWMALGEWFWAYYFEDGWPYDVFP